MTTQYTEHPRVVSPDEWLTARKRLLIKEKALTRQQDALSAERRKLPWTKVEKRYVFDGANGEETLADLFAGRTQLIIYHFMFGPDWQEGCPSCSFGMDHVDGALPHLVQRDVTFAVVSRAPYPKIDGFRKRMNWRFKWVSSHRNDFNRDYHVSFSSQEISKGNVYYNFGMNEFPSEEAPGLSVFYKDESGTVFHTYSAYARGLEPILATYSLLDLVPKGRDEDDLEFTMSWVRHHDRYENGFLADSDKPYWPKV
jgi:predicted dithiol-disulfide oxidoreductase (DUF899 family)